MKILGVMDEDPFSDLTWSGSSKYFFEELSRAGVLQRALAAEPSIFSRRWIQLLNFHPNMAKWRFKYNLDPRLYKRMGDAALRQLDESESFDVSLQVGAWYDMTSVSSKIKVSYHDGNLATLLKSPYGYPDIDSRFIDAALAHEKSLYQKLDIIFPMSHWLARSFVEDFGVPEDKVVPVGAGINLPYIREMKNKDYSGKKILMIGKDFQRKGGSVLLKAFKRVLMKVPEATLTIIGPENIGKHPRVTNLGYIDKGSPEGVERLLAAYAESTIFVMPSLYEPFGIVFAEAMAHRLPCIGTDSCAMPEIIDDGESGYVVAANDDEALSDRIVRLLENPELCQAMGDQGFEKYQSTYNWTRVIEKIVAAIDRKL